MPARRCTLLLLFGCLRHAGAQTYAENLPPNHPAIAYSAPTNTQVSPLLDRIAKLKPKLASLLTLLNIPVDSQALVFSKTSIQAAHISPANPRAIYFNDTTAVAYVPGANDIEIATLDPVKGAIFYTLNTAEASLTRSETCLHCHQGPATLGVPGFFIGSVFPNPQGQPSRSGSIITDHRTPFADRWGGWYVTPAQGEPPDRANAVAANPADPETLETKIDEYHPNNYLSPFSDIVALMTFEHQTHVTSLITRLNWESRLHPDASNIVEIEELVAYMLFTGEAELHEPLAGASTFSGTFPRRGPCDRNGRSLRDFDLRSRLFRYPLSYMVYSAAFDAIPEKPRQQIYRRLYEILTGRDSSPRFSHLSPVDRRNILDILRETKPNLPSYWAAASRAGKVPRLVAG